METVCAQNSAVLRTSCRAARRVRSAARPVAALQADKKDAAAATLSAAASAVALCAAGPVHAANMAVGAVADAGAVGLTLGATGAIAGLAFVLINTDPDKRRKDMAQAAGGDEKESVRNYFNTAGFERWNKIYGTTSEVNKVQMDIRTGHAQTVEKVLDWMKGDGNLKGVSICDAGCGTGSLAIPLALAGMTVEASDISSSMAGEAQKRFEAQVAAGAVPPTTAPKFLTSDLESLAGKYHTVTCLDVMIHYPQDKADAMVQHLASLAEQRLIISFAPRTLAYLILKRIGELFPGPSKATRAYLHAEEDVESALSKVGWKVKRREMTATSFYFSRLLEFERA